MDPCLFTITCTTCQARLQVRDPEVIGTILACPKCESMVQVLPPKGWVAPTPSTRPEASPESKPTDRAAQNKTPPVAAPAARAEEGPSPSPSPSSDSVRPPVAPSPSRAEARAAAAGVSGVMAGSAAIASQGPAPPPLPKGASGPALPGTNSAPPLPTQTAVPSAPELVVGPPISAQAPAPPPPVIVGRAPWGWPTWLAVAGASCAAMGLAVGVWTLMTRSSPAPEPAPVSAVAESSQPEPVAKPSGPQTPVPWDGQWLPAETRLVVCVQLAALAEMPQSQRWIDQTHPFWQQAIAPALAAFGLAPEQVDRILFASTDLAQGPRVDLLVLKLPASSTARTGKAADLDFSLSGVVCRRLESASWPYPFAQVDAQTIVTGAEPILRKLATNPHPELESLALRRLLPVLPSEAAFSVRLDLAAARAAHWPLPTTWSDIWAPGREAWRALWEVPDGVGLAVQAGDRVHTELAWSCEASSSAEKVLALLESLLDQGRQAVAVGLESLTDKLQAGRFSAAVGDQYELLLRRGLAAMRSARLTASNEVVTVRMDWDLALPAFGKAAMESRPALQDEWLEAASQADEANHRRLLASLGGYQKAEGSMPAGAAGGSLLPPETRLSWLATMLPYFGHSDWHRQLEFSYPWNSPQNKPVSSRTLSAVVNPALGPARTEAGFPVTHYVGCAGVGADAGTLKADDPRAGVFGYGRGARSGDLAAGASHTIAILPVAREPGAWAAGGAATVRGLTQKPYVNGPDGFGSGQPDGMYVGMADGSVRFVSKDVDPRVLEQLATVRGGEGVDLARLDPRAVPAKEPKQGPEPAPESPAAANKTETPKKPTPEPPAAVSAATREAAPEPAAPAHPVIDVAPRLATVLPRIEMKDAPFEDVIALTAQLGQVPLTLDLDAMARLGVKLDDRVSVKLAGASVAKVLQTAAEARGLALAVEGNLVQVTSPADERQKLYAERYDVGDLTRNDPNALLELAAMIRELVAPDSWKSAGGRGAISPQESSLKIDQVGAVHWQVNRFCEKLRNARHLPLRSSGDPQQYDLASRHAKASPTLGQVVTVNLYQPVPLQKAVALLENAAKARILVDWAALSLAGVGFPVNVTARIDRQPLGTGLNGLLEPLGLGYRIVAPDLLEITTRKRVADRLELEFYPASDLVGRMTPQALVEQVRGHVAKSTWNDAGGPAAIRFDAPSKCLLVLQSQPAQAEIERLLSELRKNAKGRTRNDEH